MESQKERILMAVLDRLLSSDDEGQAERERPTIATRIPIGSYVVVRCRDAGVHAGELVAWSGRTAELKESRRLWRWHQARGGLLSGVANYGLNHEKSIVGSPCDIILTETCEIIACTHEAAQSIANAPNSHEEEQE